MMGLRKGIEDKATVSSETSLASVNNGDPEDIWAFSEGYTPLQDATLDSDAGFLISSSNSTAFRTSDATIFFQTIDDEDEDDPESPNHLLVHDDPPPAFEQHSTVPQTSPDGTLAIPTSESTRAFDGIAENALRILEHDYQNTIQRKGREQTDIQASAESINRDEEINMGSTELAQDETQSLFLADFEQFSHEEMAPEGRIADCAASMEVNSKAVLQAVESIRAKDPRITSKFEAWDRQQQERRQRSLSQIHPIVPSAPLAAFHNSTTKAIQASARFSRSGTLAEALRRLDLLRGSTQNLRIHVVGCDAVECDALKATFGPIVRWLGNYVECPGTVQFDLIGPNIPSRLSTILLNLNSETANSDIGRLLSATLKCHSCLYHELESDCTPDLIVAFNAGIWGYDDWIPCLEYLLSQAQKVPFVATAYTVEEAEDDFDVIHGLAAKHGVDSSACLAWSTESNPFGSQLPRETASAVAGRIYRENAAWQAWTL